MEVYGCTFCWGWHSDARLCNGGTGATLTYHLCHRDQIQNLSFLKVGIKFCFSIARFLFVLTTLVRFQGIFNQINHSTRITQQTILVTEYRCCLTGICSHVLLNLKNSSSVSKHPRIALYAAQDVDALSP